GEEMSNDRSAQMPRLRRMTAAIAAAAIMTGGALTASASAQAAAPGHLGGSAVTGQVEGRTYVLLGPSVFGVTVQQDPLAYLATKRADGTVRGHWSYHYFQAGQETTFSGPVTCLTVTGNRAWIGGPITESSDPTQVGMGAWWQVADNGTGRHPVIPDQTTFAGIGTLAQTQAYCDNAPAPHFIFDVQLGGVQVSEASGG
ncbi:MAG TPA: hypothetical protein VK162_00120, partial [Streptosporangiaceae bacterium]|nr:hypothetical protein [Streptosporangiaceae bacterium]